MFWNDADVVPTALEPRHEMFDFVPRAVHKNETSFRFLLLHHVLRPDRWGHPERLGPSSAPSSRTPLMSVLLRQHGRNKENMSQGALSLPLMVPPRSG
ncbi:hypothetical protein MGG_16889 [Pyricularia oryzae 70-15]|uniref:Uncharacterized protein n=4 Tax=Pyricularia oryzae TaxID=318829 RepID=G4N5B2_PYRO7|nr:uncharacterized protein MGG_16889 [Pyricularia oryzae 70-15]ELQ38815.1 hypothetical protein OOU_Y34scaffold00526g13 [Pyricularia oryzae Y34]KAI7915148.1 hypothetical protein M9X92_008588 [Pyricularia oryzae]EHA52969.1 hypothetical protein MGG_16889 [Pyricularia oryzae 70-15]KAI7916866.1 hypothetical protein M0657_008352 [Pyricularia oryzae]QBZ59598.1 hypothetical protein PoMZ_04560 [Pyricularia oryzae]